MKALIWIICIISLSLTIVLLGYAGIILGGIPTAMLYSAMFGIALALCKKWDIHKNTKNKSQNNDNTSSSTKENPDTWNAVIAIAVSLIFATIFIVIATRR